MFKRILTAVVAIAVFLPVLYYSNTVVFPIVVTACCVVGVFEMLRCIGLLRRWVVSVPLLIAAVFPMLPWFFNSADVKHHACILTIVLMVYLFAILTFSKQDVLLQEIAVGFLTVLYVIAAFTCIVMLRYHGSSGVQYRAGGVGQYLYLICFIGAWVTDTFAYFVGMFFGKHKLIPHVSPKKTVEGSIGGVLFCMLSMVVYGYIVQYLAHGDLKAAFIPLAVSGLFISVVSQVGDLLMSKIKRQYDVKDYGKLFPGHGGVLDRFDSVMAVAVTMAVISSFTNLFQVTI